MRLAWKDFQEQDYVEAVVRSQRVIELSIKSHCRLHSGHAKRDHNAAIELYEEYQDRISPVLLTHQGTIGDKSEYWAVQRLHVVYGNDAEWVEAEDWATASKAEKAAQDAEQISGWMWEAMPFHPQVNPDDWKNEQGELRDESLACGPDWIIASWMLRAREVAWYGASWPARDLAARIAGHLHGEETALGEAAREFAVQLAQQGAEILRNPALHAFDPSQKEDHEAVSLAALRRLEGLQIAPQGASEEVRRRLLGDSKEQDLDRWGF